jgi:hypothetical protein
MKLPRIQLHLSTCIVLMFVAGGLVWANLRPFDFSIASKDAVNIDFDESAIPFGQTWGWPARVYATGFIAYAEKIMAGTGDSHQVVGWSYKALILNILTAFALLSATAYVCESFLYRRARATAKS